MAERAVQDLSALPTYGYGPRSAVWWGTVAFVAIEATGFALAIGAYLYLVHINPRWPLGNTVPNHWPGTVLTVLLIVSVWPNIILDRKAHEERLKPAQVWLVVMTVIGVVAIAIRFYEFFNLAVNWDQNAYGSIIWVLLGLHATHIITDVADTAVLTALMFTRHAVGKRFSDVSDNCFYWHFVVIAWVPIYVFIYWVPRLG